MAIELYKANIISFIAFNANIQCYKAIFHLFL